MHQLNYIILFIFSSVLSEAFASPSIHEDNPSAGAYVDSSPYLRRLISHMDHAVKKISMLDKKQSESSRKKLQFIEKIFYKNDSHQRFFRQVNITEEGRKKALDILREAVEEDDYQSVLTDAFIVIRGSFNAAGISFSGCLQPERNMLTIMQVLPGSHLDLFLGELFLDTSLTDDEKVVVFYQYLLFFHVLVDLYELEGSKKYDAEKSPLKFDVTKVHRRVKKVDTTPYVGRKIDQYIGRENFFTYGPWLISLGIFSLSTYSHYHAMENPSIAGALVGTVQDAVFNNIKTLLLIGGGMLLFKGLFGTTSPRRR